MADLTDITDDLADRVLAVNLDSDFGMGLRTVRDYLVHLLDQVWDGDAGAEDGFTGNDDWEYDIYKPLHRAGMIPAWEDGWGLQDAAARYAAALVSAAIRRLHGGDDCVPTQAAYDAACAALEKHRQRADRAEEQVEDLRRRARAVAEEYEREPRPIGSAAVAGMLREWTGEFRG